MGLFEWMNSKIVNMKWYDMGFVKLSTAAFILMIAKLWEPLLALDLYWYLVIAVLAGIKPCIGMFKKEAVVAEKPAVVKPKQI